MIKFSKKMLALVMSMLMIFSCMAVSASAEGEEATKETVQISAPVCEFDQETMTISVAKPDNIHHGENYYPVDITIAPAEGVTKTVNADGSVVFSGVVLETEYTVTAALNDNVDDTVTVEGTASKKVTPTITVPGTKNICTFSDADRTITATNLPGMTIGGNTFSVVLAIEPSASVMTTSEGKTMFYNLEYGKTYTVKAYVAPSADAKTYYSEDNFTVTVKNKQDAPSTPVPAAITSSSITVIASAGCKYALKDADGEFVYNWTDSEGKSAILFGELAAETTYSVVAKKDATATHYESAEASIKVTTKKAGKTGVPTITLADKTNTSITVDAGKDVEYKLGDGKWQTSGEFKGLKADTQYNIYARFTFDAAKEDPSAVTEAFIVKTNAVANFEADEKKISFKGDDGAYANSEIKFTATGNGPADMNKVVYGDTRIVPVAYKVVFGDATIKDTTPFANPNKVTNNGSFTAEAYAEKVVSVKVTFMLEEYKGKNADGSANWVAVKPIEKSFDVNVGRVDSPMTKITEFFEGILNFLLNTVPAFLAEALQSDVWGRLFDVLGNLGGALGG